MKKEKLKKHTGMNKNAKRETLKFAFVVFHYHSVPTTRSILFGLSEAKFVVHDGRR
jgi:hypothetical protein